MPRKRKAAKPKVKPEPVPLSTVEDLAQEWWDYVIDEPERPEFESLGRLPIDDVRAFRVHCLESNRECMTRVREEWKYADQEREQARVWRAAAWRCQLEINKHNAFLKRQHSFAF